MKSQHSTLLEYPYVRIAMALFVGTLLVSGCSSSGGEQEPAGASTSGESGVDTPITVTPSDDNRPIDSTAEGDEPVEDDKNPIDDQDPITDAPTNNDTDGNVEQPGNSGATDDAESTGGASQVGDPVQSDEGTAEPEGNMPDTDTGEPLTDGNQPDPMSPITTVVDFEITVPAYMSNELQVEIRWGDKDLRAQWVGDELWTASGTFPIDTTRQLTIRFVDGNGDIALGAYEQEFQTGTNASEIIQISAEQFNAEQWDADGDGVSNIDELIAGTDPLTAETQLEIVDAYYDYNAFWLLLADVSPQESVLTDLPYIFEDDNSRIDIDDNGTGTFSFSRRDTQPGANTTTIDSNTTRTNTGNSILYNSLWQWYNTSAARRDERGIVSDTQALDENTRTQTAELTRWESGTGSDYRDKTNYTLTGPIIEGKKSCEPSYGVLTYENTKIKVNKEIVLTTVSKEIDDQYWHVTTTTPDGSVVEEYLARSLGKEFYCAMVGL